MDTDEKWALADITLMAVMAAVLVFYALGDWDWWARFLAAYWLGRVSGILLARIIP